MRMLPETLARIAALSPHIPFAGTRERVTPKAEPAVGSKTNAEQRRTDSVADDRGDRGPGGAVHQHGVQHRAGVV